MRSIEPSRSDVDPSARAPVDLFAGLRAIERASKEPEIVEQELLRDLVAHNADTEYGRRFGFRDISDLHTYQRRLPLVTYAELAPYIERMMRGERDVLFKGETIFVAQTSGTTAKPKYYPYPDTELAKGRTRIGGMLALLERDHPGCIASHVFIGGKYWEDTAPSGVPIGSASGFSRRIFDLAGQILPDAVQDATDFEARYYAMLRIMLAAPLRMIMTFNPSTILTLFDKAVEYAKPLIADLVAGTMRNGPTCPAELQQAIEPGLRREPEAAQRLASAIATRERFIAEHVWPELELIVTWKASMAVHYLRELGERCPSCVIRSMLNAATEGVLTVPLEAAWTGGIPAGFESILEWFPEKEAPRPEDAIPVRELRPGEGYRLAISNHRGLYRYLMEDVFVVEDRHRGLPVLTFSHRFGATSSLTGEKLTEPQVIEAMTTALATAEARFVDFQLQPEWGRPPGYVLVVELTSDCHDAQLRTVLHRFESTLVALNVEYRSKRSSGRLADPKLVVVGAGAFQRARRQRSDDRGRGDATVKIARLSRDFYEHERVDVVRTVSWSAA